MAKRLADKELTDRNWDQEDEAEEAGTFSVATKDVLKSREIKKAKRRNVGGESEKAGAFKGFQGLVSSGSAFSAFGASTKPLQGLSNGNGSTSLFSSSKPTAEAKPNFGSLFANGPQTTSSTSLTMTGASSIAKTNGETPSSTSSSATSKPCGTIEYNKQLTSLNCSVRDWIVKHVNANPLCDLTPIFKDYEKHLASIEQKYGSVTDSGSESDSTFTPTIPMSSSETQTPFSFSIKEEKPEASAQPATNKKAQPASLFSFGQKSDSASLGSFGSGAATAFSFKAAAGNMFSQDSSKSNAGTPSFTFQADSSAKSKDSDGGGENEEEEEPPKVVISEVKETDAFYSKKCKLFYKKENEFKEKGVGTLHLKPVGDQKTQLLVRADTNLGNILLNILVQPSMPCSRMGKNNVMIVCVPNPPIDEKNPTVPVTMLIRVKTTEDADELQKLLLEKKGA